MKLRDYKSYSVRSDFSLMGRVKIQFLVVAALILGSLFITQLIFATSLATDGEKLVGVENNIAQLEQQNANLKVKIAQKSSLAILSQKAQELGFKKPSQVITP